MLDLISREVGFHHQYALRCHDAPIESRYALSESGSTPKTDTVDIDPRHLAGTKQYTVGEEIANSIVHGLGIVFGIVGLTLNLVFSSMQADTYKIVASIIYGLAMILEYTASTLYHSIPHPKAKYIFKILDHAAIYLLIAGTYTPFCLVSLRETGGIQLLVFIWAFAVLGISIEAFWVYRPKWVSAVIYLIMGWLVVFSIGDLAAVLDPAGVYLLIAGGLCYTIGTAFYVYKKVPYLHSVWHMWVLAGTVLHFFSILLYVILWG